MVLCRVVFISTADCCPLLSIVIHWNERLLYLSMMKMFFWYYHCNHNIDSPAAQTGCRGHADPQNNHLPRRSLPHPLLRHVAGCRVAGNHWLLISFKIFFFFWIEKINLFFLKLSNLSIAIQMNIISILFLYPLKTTLRHWPCQKADCGPQFSGVVF